MIKFFKSALSTQFALEVAHRISERKGAMSLGQIVSRLFVFGGIGLGSLALSVIMIWIASSGLVQQIHTQRLVTFVAIAGGLVGLHVTGLTLNIYSQIGILMLVGIAAKNGILIVEFINQLRDADTEFDQAVLDGARIRFRPVIMTTISTVMGSIPLILATGPGSESRTTLGIVMFFGVTLATVFTLFVVPVFYSIFARATGSPGAVAKKLDELSRELAGT